LVAVRKTKEKIPFGYNEKKQRKKQNCTLVEVRKTEEETKLHFGLSEKNKKRENCTLIWKQIALLENH